MGYFSVISLIRMWHEYRGTCIWEKRLSLQNHDFRLLTCSTKLRWLICLTDPPDSSLPRRWLADTYGAPLNVAAFEAGVHQALRRGVKSGELVLVKAKRTYKFRLGDALEAAPKLRENRATATATKEKAAAKPKVCSFFFVASKTLVPWVPVPFFLFITSHTKLEKNLGKKKCRQDHPEALRNSGTEQQRNS